MLSLSGRSELRVVAGLHQTRVNRRQVLEGLDAPLEASAPEAAEDA
jgi:hypothetical protein